MVDIDGLMDCGNLGPSAVSPKIKMWQGFRNVSCLVLLFVYLTFIPGGKAGFGIILVCLVINLTLMPNIQAFGLYLLLFGVKTLGLVTLVFGFPGLGGKIAVSVGLFILLIFTNFRKTLIDIKGPILYISWIGAVLFLSYLNGPKTDYCTEKLVSIVTNGVFLVVPLYYLFNSESLDWHYLGKLGILSALVCFSALIIISPSVKPDSILSIASMRISSMLDENIIEIRNLVSGLAKIGFVVLFASSVDRFLSRLSLANLLTYSCAALITISFSGSRLPFITLVIVVISIFMVKPLYEKRYKLIAIATICVVFLIFSYGLSQQLQIFTSVTDSTSSYSSRLNRDTNWYAGYRRIIEKPLLGQGLGGYYIEGYSYPGSGTYAHNLGLELLSETGIVGTLAILFPLVMWGRFVKISFLTRAKNGGAVFPLLLMAVLQAMVSFNLTSNIGLFSMVSVIFVLAKNQIDVNGNIDMSASK